MPEVLEQLGVRIDFQFHFIFATLVWVRLLGMVAVVPFLFGKPVPTMVRVGAAVILMAFAYPHLLPAAAPAIIRDPAQLFVLYLKEAFVGLSIGLAVAMVFYGFEAAGSMIDNQRGMSIARVLIPELGTMDSQGGQFLFLLAGVTYLSMGGHLLFLEAFFESYRAVPIFELPNVQPGLLPLMDLFAAMTGHVLAMSLQIAAPVIIAILLADIILGVANRVAPQINVWELGFNIKGYLGILMLALTLAVMMHVVQPEFLKSFRDVRQVIRALQGKVPTPPEAPKPWWQVSPTPPEASTPQ
ncbi:MAG: flagellar biosynthetic protein FliR [Deltaproteobacteria bacterium]|nr:flagellar biosynthetic protein FliR [Deltaproteobacteria bacterium]